jgi:hypothetical protein
VTSTATLALKSEHTTSGSDDKGRTFQIFRDPDNRRRHMDGGRGGSGVAQYLHRVVSALPKVTTQYPNVLDVSRSTELAVTVFV